MIARTDKGMPAATADLPQWKSWDLLAWARNGFELQSLLFEYATERMADKATFRFFDPGAWRKRLERLAGRVPASNPQLQQRFFGDGVELWQTVLGQLGVGPLAAKDGEPAQLPRQDRRFRNPKWRERPAYAVLHQAYLMWSEQMLLLVDTMPGLSPRKREKLGFATRALVEALSPANFPATNPVVLERIVETRGESLVQGMKHLLADMKRGQLTHTDPTAYEVGRNIATTPGKVVLESRLFQLIQYSPTTENVLAVPLVVFPPWINRFYVLDLNEKKSFVRWAVEQGITVFMASWKSADASMADVTMDDYVRAQIEAIDFVRERLDVPAVHTVGYCVAGTTMAATLAVLARRGQADKVRSATFFTAQVDFEKAGELGLMVDESHLAMMESLVTDGYFDGRHMGATFNLLRSSDLIWQYVIEHYLLGEDYSAFDLLHWNGDPTNLPWRWHKAYLTDLYRDNRLVEPNSIVVDGTPVDLARIEIPTYIQAGREDHIAPAESVWRATRHFRGPLRFVLAGSGHIAGVVNPPAGGKYQYWTNPNRASTLEEFIAGATETKGSWWPDWLEWLKSQDTATVPAKGKRAPGGRGDQVIEDAPGSYVRMR